MKTRFFTFLLALLTTIIFGGVKAAGTYTINVTQGYTLTASDLQAINVLGVQNVISLSTSGSDRILKNASGTTLFTYNSSTYKCSLPASVSSANNLTSAITLDAYTLTTMGASSMVNYSSIAMKFPNPVAYAEYNTNSTLTFHYDHLRSTFSTTYLMNTGTNTPGWSGKNPETVTFDSNFANYRPTSCYKWFEDMTYLKTINGLDNLRTENVTNMSRMFRNTGITSLTLRSYFNTSNVTDMSYMFYGCSNLTFLSIPGNFITTKVTNMNQMFYSCSSLTKLNLSNFYISSSTSTQSMLSVMPSLQELTLSTSLVNYLSSSACTNIGTDFYGNVDTPCALIYPTSAHLSNVQASSNYVKWNGGYFTCSSMKPYVLVNGPALTFFCDDYYAAKQGTSGFYDLNTGYYTPGWHDNRESITTVVFNSSFAYAKPTSCYKWFDGMKNLTSITGLRNLNTSNVTNMQWMFYYCPKLTSLDVSNFNTAKVTDMSYMFDGCSALTSLDLSNFNTANVTNMQNMFIYCSALTSLNVSNFNTANVTNMAFMFRECSALTSLNLSNFNTANVTDMKHMFYDCRALTNLNLSNFNTANVTDMEHMFYKCSALTSLNLSNFNTAKVTNMDEMFNGCSGLTTLNVSNFNTANVTYMKNMFYDCKNLTSLNVSSFNTANVDDMRNLFRGCSKLTSLNLSNFNIGNAVTWDLLTGCTGLKSLNLSASLLYKIQDNGCTGIGTATAPCTLIYPTTEHPTFTEVTPTYVRWNNGYFTCANIKPYACLDGTSLTFYYDDFYAVRQGATDVYDMNTASNDPGWYASRTNITSVTFNSSFANARPTSCYKWFYGMSIAAISGLNYLNTSNVTNMYGMFALCQDLGSLDVSDFNTEKVTNMESMFAGLSVIKSLDVSSFNTTRVTNMQNMFKNCSQLISLDLSNFTISSSTNTSGMLNDMLGLQTLTLSSSLVNYLNSNACTHIGTNIYGTLTTPCTLNYPADVHLEFTALHPTYVEWKNGYFTVPNMKPYASLSGSTLTFYYDENYASRQATSTVYDLNTGDNIPGWSSNCESITSVVFDSSFTNARPTSCYYWFSGMKNLTSITGLDNLNTSDVTNMGFMFHECSGLTSLDVSNFNTARVTNMQNMFSNCRSLTSLDVSHFNTANVSNMSGMFYDCRSLTSLSVNNFSTAKVTNMAYMFFLCSGLTSLDLSNFDANIGDSDEPYRYFLNGCSALESLSLSASLTSRLGALACNGIGTAEAPCTLIYPTSVYLSFSDLTPTSFCWHGGFFTSPNIRAYACLYEYPKGKSLHFHYDDQYVTTQSDANVTVYDLNTGSDDPGWYSEAENITSVTFDYKFRHARPTSCHNWFANMYNISSFYQLNMLNTSEVTNMSSMFSNCTLIESLDLSHFNTSKVTTMDYMFFGCRLLDNLNISSFNVGNATNLTAMFANCDDLDTLDLSASLVANMPANACIGVGSMGAPCALTYPAGTAIEKEATGAGWFLWRGGYFADAPSFLLGDVNSDDKVTIADVTALVNIILGKDPDGQYNRDAADVNADSKVTIADVTALVNVILGK